MTTSPAPAPQKTEKGTEYLVLAADDQGGWQEGLVVRASSAKAAVQSAALTGLEGVYVAVPQRSWKPVKVTVETTKTVRLG